MTSKYEMFQFTTDLPKALLPNGEDFIVENSYHGKGGAVIRITDTNRLDLVSVHDRMDLADRRARKEERELPKESTDDVLAVPIKLVPRNNTYFDVDGAYGNADELLVLDTSTWTPAMWQRLQWTGGHRLVLAKHFDAKIHEFEEISYSTSPTTKVTKLRCKECYMVEENLNL